MDDAAVVRGGEAARRLERDLDRPPHRERAAGQPVAQRLAIQDLGDEIGGVVLRAGVEDGEDVRVIERRGGPRLLLEAADALGVGAQGGGEDLDRHVAPEARVPGAVDLPHPARAERADDLVRAEPRAGGEHGEGEGILQL